MDGALIIYTGHVWLKVALLGAPLREARVCAVYLNFSVQVPRVDFDTQIGLNGLFIARILSCESDSIIIFSK